MSVNQTATLLVTGTTGITVPRVVDIETATSNLEVGSARVQGVSATDPVGDARLVKVLLDIPTITATAKSLAVSLDGSTWRPVTYDIFQLQAFPTPSTYTGNQFLEFGPYLPGTRFRVTGGAVATGTCKVYFGI